MRCVAVRLLSSTLLIGLVSPVGAQTGPTGAPQSPQPPVASAPSGGNGSGVVVPADYVIGPDDVLAIAFWREKELSAEVVVRPDGKISLPLLNEVHAAGLTPEQLRERVMQEANRYVEDPNATIVVKEINSRRVFITGMVHKPGPYSLTSPMTVIQLIALAGGLQEYAKEKNIAVMREEDGKQVRYRVNYRDLVAGRNLRQNIDLRPGDTVIVP
jgi:polysaccharide biosynthesis/export protein